MKVVKSDYLNKWDLALINQFGIYQKRPKNLENIKTKIYCESKYHKAKPKILLTPWFIPETAPFAKNQVVCTYCLKQHLYFYTQQKLGIKTPSLNLPEISR